MADPWEKTLFVETEQLLTSKEGLVFRESNIKDRMYPFFSLGMVIAEANSLKIAVGDAHKSNIINTVRRGHPVIIDLGGSYSPPTMDPVSFAQQFTVPFHTYREEEFNTFLAGYIRYSQIMLDKIRPGFTAALLEVLGCPDVIYPGPRKPYLDINNFLYTVKSKIDFSGKTVIQPDPGLAAQEIDKDSEKFTVSILALYLIGFDVTKFVATLDLAQCNSEHGRFSVQLLTDAFIEGKIERGNMAPPGIQSVACDIIAKLLEQGRLADDFKQEPFFTYVKSIFEFFNDTSKDTSIIITFVDHLVDACWSIAEIMREQPSQNRRELFMAQMAYMIFQYGPHDRLNDEERFLLMIKQEQKHSCCCVKLKDIEESGEYLGFLAFLRSKSNALISIYRNSLMKDHHPMPSFFWDSVNIHRMILESFIDVNRMEMTDDALKTFDQIAEMFIRSLLGCFQMSLFDINNMDLDSDGEIYLKKDIDRVGDLFQFVKTGTVRDAKGIELLKRIKELD